MESSQLSGIYCNSLTRYQRLLTREVFIGDVALGGNNPIRVQSMTTTDTMNTMATVEQSIRMIEAGCEFVRITAPSINEAKNLENIKAELRKRGYKTPLIADIHFTPNAAEVAARIVEKVRINPGNFADKKRFEFIEYTNNEYEAELSRIRERFIPLVKICKEYGTAMRIGTNHGSLSDRIMSRYGDTAHGMVESALEFLRICESQNYYNLVLSMKSSNPQVMVQAYRLLIARMKEENMNYPLHLGVTEAGEGEDGRIKSAEGIGTLLEDGIGDTVRVSLTEDPEFEIPVARALVGRYNNRANHNPIGELKNTLSVSKKDTIGLPNVHGLPYSPFEYKRRESFEVLNMGAHEVPRVIIDYSKHEKITAASLFAVGYNYSVPTDKWNLTDQACDFIYAGNHTVDFAIPGTLGVICNAAVWMNNSDNDRFYPMYEGNDFFIASKTHAALNFIRVESEEISSGNFDVKKLPANAVLILNTTNEHAMPSLRRAFISLVEGEIKNPVIIERGYSDISNDTLQLYSSTDLGGLLLDGFGDGVFIRANGNASPQMINSLGFGILQAARTRISKTEYISCPSCGRTLFDLQETTAKIRSRTDHLKGIKIGIMGCIVNGPGEMADADYGYVGSGVGKITLYKGREVVTKSIDASEAVDALIDLIREHGDWVEKNN
ncbi:MAG TPA: (E)-4-hydroxy-3-methylbut-2-enyl-diphosphate synthase [Bacteroidia bacterium]|nr:(E)-4-hydroxy-3-methylbut-2-enyl-diphosphate synthase [Bacteroidia bacterium]HQF27562.1 (E)-4-hydroxy-3-methylbut-2-enyl-diphosphate synthase [Bacteroidia bacterium]HQK97639.1 (E)-4-hydroxy-3-methylbut-2-enyl-diphosphate synthase [Bacteroidia bacterium]